jgi:tRNA (guanine37-N1)-methyltransferase
MEKMRAFEVIGSIAILQHNASKENLKKIANEILKTQKNVKTVLAKKDRVKGRLRTRKLDFISGIKTKETIHKENNCIMKLNVETCYFSPRLSNERQEIASQIKKKEKVLVMFGGIAPFSIVIAKKQPSSEVYSIELGRECSRYAEENAKLNKLNNIRIIQGDVKRIIPKLKGKIRFDRIVMPRPQLKETFLKEAFAVSKKGAIINYYDFADEDEIKGIRKKIEKEAKKSKRKIKIIKINKAGNIAPYRFRVRIDFKVI